MMSRSATLDVATRALKALKLIHFWLSSGEFLAPCLQCYVLKADLKLCTADGEEIVVTVMSV